MITNTRLVSENQMNVAGSDWVLPIYFNICLKYHCLKTNDISKALIDVYIIAVWLKIHVMEGN